MALTYCPHGMPTPASCTLCMEDGPVAPPSKNEPVTTLRVLTAKYEGQCDACDLPIIIGQTIRLLSNDQYIHAACGDV